MDVADRSSSDAEYRGSIATNAAFGRHAGRSGRQLPVLDPLYSGISLRPIDGDEAVDIPIPEGAKISGIDWSHHSNCFAFTTVTDDGQQLWIARVEDPANPIQVTDRLSTVTGGLDWMPDGQSILCQLIPEDRGSEPEASRTPVGPNIQES